ncbi:glycogen operon protein GlgX homolog [Microbacterium sorbitolivorans]|uniref:Glycogen debranching enzyme GlgX n=1 Tax=Microbacterium sorbitolivorans TaxID=1867410 RepID=A0A367Y3V1_9MICO|nr:glycogen debranching protein GlgX [Microbacterium sorbitolivorans]RCK59711.1 glycogen debranching enzyme GlgX [Microbacterium sorbitolivorans]GGF39276.1 glycogen operon protein GlgX homolog [Microbacterium sorbitolivorans]
MKLGVTLTDTGADVAVWAPAADRVWFCRVTDDGREDRTRLPYVEGGIWHGSVADVVDGTRYGIRAAGPGLDPHTLLVDPYAVAIDGRLVAGEPVPYGIVRTPSSTPSWSFSGDLVIYEAHVKGLTALRSDIPSELRGTYAGAALMAPYLASLGVTALELLPIQAFIDDDHVVANGLTNYWGYQPIAWHAPEPRYAHEDAEAEVLALVNAMHAEGIAVIVDVVYNHTGEGGHGGPVLSLKGLAPQAYRMHDGEYVNDAGTGNTVAAEEPLVLRLILDSLRHWATRYGIDGFRFDLAATLGRSAGGFDSRAAFFQAVGQDPVLSNLILIAEPWDIGPGGYQLGAFPHPWREWNDRFRDDVRRAWRGDPLMLSALSARLLGSAAEFDHSGRTAHTSVNFITAHDGFTLADLVSYEQKHNLDNREDGNDGHSENFSSNGGAEGLSSDPDVLARRERRMRGMIATLAVSQGVPMLLAGDEAGNSQGGNNNAYAQDNEVGWVSWSGVSLADFVRDALATRARLPILRQRAFLHGGERATFGRDVTWLRADGNLVEDEDWQDPDFRTIVAVLRGAAGDPDGEAIDGSVAIVVNLGCATTVDLPAGRWAVELDSSGSAALTARTIVVPEETLVVLSGGFVASAYYR